MLGILGGMGPMATADFLRKLVVLRPARTDQDHIPAIIWSDPRVPDRTTALTKAGPDPLPALKEATRGLISAGASAIVIPCNTAHYWADALLPELGGRPLLHIVDAAIDVFRSRGFRRIGVMATNGTLAGAVYERRLLHLGLEPINPPPAEQAEVMRAITAIKGGDLATGRAVAERQFNRLLARSDAVVLACTELPLVLPGRSDGRMVDATEALARAAISWWDRERIQPGDDTDMNDMRRSATDMHPSHWIGRA